MSHASGYSRNQPWDFIWNVVKLKPAQAYTTVTYMFWEILNAIVSLQFFFFWGGGAGGMD